MQSWGICFSARNAVQKARHTYAPCVSRKRMSILFPHIDEEKVSIFAVAMRARNDAQLVGRSAVAGKCLLIIRRCVGRASGNRRHLFAECRLAGGSSRRNASMKRCLHKPKTGWRCVILAKSWAAVPKTHRCMSAPRDINVGI